jgi:hypothetical protein
LFQPCYWSIVVAAAVEMEAGGGPGPFSLEMFLRKPNNYFFKYLSPPGLLVLPHEKEKMKQERIEGKEVVLSSVD